MILSARPVSISSRKSTSSANTPSPSSALSMPRNASDSTIARKLIWPTYRAVAVTHSTMSRADKVLTASRMRRRLTPSRWLSSFSVGGRIARAQVIGEMYS